jgi:hypothetical protein
LIHSKSLAALNHPGFPKQSTFIFEAACRVIELEPKN